MSGLPGGIDALDERTRTGWGPFLLALGAAAVIFGVLFVVNGIKNAVDAATGIREDAVATGFVGCRSRIEGADAKQTVYLDLDGIVNSVTQEAIVADTDCRVIAGDFRAGFSGSRQGVSTTIGDLSSVGTFTLPEGFGRLECVNRGDRQVPLIVTPTGRRRRLRRGAEDHRRRGARRPGHRADRHRCLSAGAEPLSDVPIIGRMPRRIHTSSCCRR